MSNYIRMHCIGVHSLLLKQSMEIDTIKDFDWPKMFSTIILARVIDNHVQFAEFQLHANISCT